MSRMRSLSSEISTDKRLIKLTLSHGPLPMLLYTLAIPHADDWGRLKGDPIEFISQVCPALLSQVDDCETAIAAIAEVGLWRIYTIGESTYIAFPRDAWFKYQNYVNAEKREFDGSKYPAPPGEIWQPWEDRPSATKGRGNSDGAATNAPIAKDQQDAAENSKNPQEKPKNPASPSPSPTIPPIGPPKGDHTQRDSERKRGTHLPDPWEPSEELLLWAATNVPAVDVSIETLRFCNHFHSKTGPNATKLDWAKTWQNWLLEANSRLRPQSTPASGGGYSQQPQRSPYRGKEIL